MTLKPYMQDNEIELFGKYLLKSSNYIEFGAGGSTIYALEKNIKNIYSIETDISWINKLKKFKLIQDKLNKKELTIKYLDLECKWWKHVSWRSSTEFCSKKNWSLYSKLANECTFTPDLILIDGRFRVASALESIKIMNDDTFLLIHDYIRKQYYVVEDFFDKIEGVLTLQVFKKKKNINMEKLDKVIEKYRLIMD